MGSLNIPASTLGQGPLLKHPTVYLTLASSYVFLSLVELFQVFYSLFQAPVSHLGLIKPS